jgi:hypothetical protein
MNTNSNLVKVTTEMGERYAQAKTNISWAQGVDKITAAGHSIPSIVGLRQTMDALHRAWAGGTHADAEFPALLDQFDAQWSAVMAEYQASN